MSAEEILNNIVIAKPCSASWDGMTGDDRVRLCELCNKNVYNISAMTRDEVMALISASDPDALPCMRLYLRRDGTVMTDDCPVAVRKVRDAARRISRIAVTSLSILLSFLPASAQTHRSESGNQGEMEPLKVRRFGMGAPVWSRRAECDSYSSDVDAFKTIRTATEIVGTDGLGAISPQYLAFGKVRALGLGARKDIESLLQTGTPAGKFYAALLLEDIDRAAGRSALRRLSLNRAKIAIRDNSGVRWTTLGRMARDQLAGKNRISLPIEFIPKFGRPQT